MEEEEVKLGEIWSGLDDETRERAIALFREIAYRFVISRQRTLDEDGDRNSSVKKSD